MNKPMNRRAVVFGLCSLVIVLLLTGVASTATLTRADTGSNWSGQYWNNTTFNGSPTISRTDPAISFNWGGGSPDPSLPAGNFSARWTLTNSFAGGLYTFRAGAQGGVRAYIDSTLLIDKFVSVSAFTTYTAQANLAPGYHVLRVDYYSEGGLSGVLFDWQPPTAAATAIPGGNAVPTGTITVIGALGPAQGTVIYEVVNVRADPSLTHAPIMQAHYGDTFPVLGETGDFQWCLVQLPDGSKAWIWRFGLYLTGAVANVPLAYGPTSAPPALANVQATIKYSTYLHDGPSAINSKKIGIIPQGTVVQVQAINTHRAWALVSGGGYQGWVFFPYLVFTSDNLKNLSEVPVHD